MSVWDSSPNGRVEGLPGSLAFCRKSVFISEMLRTQVARAFWRLLYRVFIPAFPTPPPPQPQARPRRGRPTHPVPAGPAQSGILVDREVVSLFLHFTVNPKPRVDFIDRPRCCLRGKECSINRFQQVESRWGYSGTSDRIRWAQGQAGHQGGWCWGRGALGARRRPGRGLPAAGRVGPTLGVLQTPAQGRVEARGASSPMFSWRVVVFRSSVPRSCP